MSGACPRCRRPVDHDFGIISCAGCDAILSIDFDGNVTLSEAGEVQVKESTTPMIDLSELSRIEIPNLAESVSETPMSSEMDQIPEQRSLSESPIFIESSQIIAEPIPEFISEPLANSQEDRLEEDWQVSPSQPPEPHLGEGEFVGMESPDSAAPQASDFSEDWLNQDPLPAQPTSTAMDFSDVVQYANSTELDNSTLVYNLRIEGIDHKDTRKKVLEVLSDIRLNIHTKDLASTIKGGILELNDLSPIKANVIATRLREEAVTFRWRQNVFQSEPE